MARGEEGRYQDKIIDWLKEQSYITKFNASGLTKNGVPDIIFCYKGHYMGIEVKRQKGVISDMQQQNLFDIRKNGGYGWCLKPSDWEIFKLLFEKGDFDEITEISKENEKEITKI